MKYIPTLLGNLFFIMTGWIVIPIAYPFNRGRDSWKWAWFDRIWGNAPDSIRGDVYWRHNQAPDLGGENSFRNVWAWAAWRNPAKNRHLRAGVSGIVNAVRLSGTWGHGRAKFEVSVSDVDHTFRWWILKWPFANRYAELQFGPKIFPTVIDYGPDGSPLKERPLKIGDKIKNAAISFRIRPFIKRDWDAASVAKLKEGI